VEDFTDSSRSNEPASNAAALAAAKAARLRYVSDHGPGITRHRFGKEFEYRDPRTLRGRDLTRKPLEERREILRGEVDAALPDSIRYSEAIEASPAELIEALREQGFEGVVAKRRDSVYKPGRISRRSSSGLRVRSLPRSVRGSRYSNSLPKRWRAMPGP
jgi:hypothetical protein